MSGVVSIASYNDVSWSASFGADLGPEGIGEAWSHVGNSQAKFVLKTCSDGAPSEAAGHPVGWEVIGPNSVICV